MIYSDEGESSVFEGVRITVGDLVPCTDGRDRIVAAIDTQDRLQPAALRPRHDDDTWFRSSPFWWFVWSVDLAKLRSLSLSLSLSLSRPVPTHSAFLAYSFDTRPVLLD